MIAERTFYILPVGLLSLPDLPVVLCDENCFCTKIFGIVTQTAAIFLQLHFVKWKIRRSKIEIETYDHCLLRMMMMLQLYQTIFSSINIIIPLQLFKLYCAECDKFYKNHLSHGKNISLSYSCIKNKFLISYLQH